MRLSELGFGWLIPDQPAVACGAAASGAAGLVSGLTDVAMQIFGVPLPVFLTSAAGAFGVRAYLPAVGVVRATLGSLCWTFAGCALAPLAQAVAPKVMSGIEIPTGAVAGLAMLIAAAGQATAPILIQRLQERAKTMFGGPPNQGGGNA